MQLEEKIDILNKLYMLKTFGYEYIDEHNVLNKKEDISLPKDINKLEEIVNNCNLCSISNLCNNKIFSSGEYKNKLLFIVNIAFKNDSSYQLFKDILKSILDIDINDVIILNILKCDLQVDLSLYKNEIELCKKYTLKQIEIYKPKLIICLGESYKYLKNENISIGHFSKYNNTDLFVSYEMNFILRNPSIKKDVLLHYKKIKKLLEKN